MFFKVPYIFKEKDFRPFLLSDGFDVKEEITSWIIESFLLSRYAESLAGKAAAKNVMVRDDGHRLLILGDLGYVAKGYFTIVMKIAYLGRFIYLAGEEAFTADIIPGQTKAADTCKKVDKLKFGMRLEPS